MNVLENLHGLVAGFHLNSYYAWMAPEPTQVVDFCCSRGAPKVGVDKMSAVVVELNVLGDLK